MSMELKRTALFSAIIAAASMSASAADDAGSGWKPLFNGRNLDGWQHVGPGEVVVENGTLKPVGGMGLLWHTGEKIGNAVVKVVYRVSGDSNSGVFIRIPEKPTEPWMPVNKGYEVQFDDSEDEDDEDADSDDDEFGDDDDDVEEEFDDDFELDEEIEER